jgi:hypothetical protein
MMYEVQNNPQNVYNALAEAYKFGQQPSPVANNGESGDDDPLANLDPKLLSQINDQGSLLQTLAQVVINDNNAKQAAAADADLDKELNALKDKIGDYDERYVLALMQNGLSAEDAGQAFVSMKQSLAPKPFAPTVLGNGSGGGGIPSGAIDPTKLSSKDTRSLVAQMLAQAAQQQ